MLIGPIALIVMAAMFISFWLGSKTLSFTFVGSEKLAQPVGLHK